MDGAGTCAHGALAWLLPLGASHARLISAPRRFNNHRDGPFLFYHLKGERHRKETVSDFKLLHFLSTE